MENAQKAARFTTTTLAPVGTEKPKEITIPIKKHMTDKTPEFITPLLKLLHTLMDVRAGKIIKLEINIAPIILIPITIVRAVKSAISIL